MKKKKLKELIQGPLRFHHQDIHEELDEIKNISLVDGENNLEQNNVPGSISNETS